MERPLWPGAARTYRFKSFDLEWRFVVGLGLSVSFLAAIVGCANPDGETVTSASSVDPAEWRGARAVQQCMGRLGWDLEVDTFDGSLGSPALGESDIEQYESDMSSCLAENPTSLTVTKESANEYYDALVAVADCLEANGLPVSDPPRKSDSVESMTSGAAAIDPLWDPYDAIFGGLGTSVTDEEFEEARAACPMPEFGG